MKNNTGKGNSGDYNSGDCNSGYWNSGDYNSGDRNSGYRNSGYYNSGDYNSGSWNSGYFNTDEPFVRMFNKDTKLKRNEIDIPCISLKLMEWIPEENMTDEQKKDDPDFNVKKGTLIKRPYKEAWALAWKEMDQKTKNQFLNLPNFDAEIFKEITGIDVKKKETCHNKLVEIDGKKYRLIEENDK